MTRLAPVDTAKLSLLGQGYAAGSIFQAGGKSNLEMICTLMFSITQCSSIKTRWQQINDSAAGWAEISVMKRTLTGGGGRQAPSWVLSLLAEVKCCEGQMRQCMSLSASMEDPGLYF